MVVSFAPGTAVSVRCAPGEGRPFGSQSQIPNKGWIRAARPFPFAERNRSSLALNEWSMHPEPRRQESVRPIPVSGLGQWVCCNLAWKLSRLGVEPTAEATAAADAGGPLYPQRLLMGALTLNLTEGVQGYTPVVPVRDLVGRSGSGSANQIACRKMRGNPPGGTTLV